MFPLTVRKEIDAHIADRFLEAVWREALWLVKDGVATTEEIDEAIRMGFGLRWAQMGLFETYRIAGGEAGMRHFLEQFGPCLTWPWTKLMDVPEFNDELVDLIAGQSDAQSGHRSDPGAGAPARRQPRWHDARRSSARVAARVA
jgi:carnitine 3-dehydrogenase